MVQRDGNSYTEYYENTGLGCNPVPVEGRMLKEDTLSALCGLVGFFQMIKREYILGRRGACAEVGGMRDQREKIKIYT